MQLIHFMKETAMHRMESWLRNHMFLAAGAVLLAVLLVVPLTRTTAISLSGLIIFYALIAFIVSRTSTWQVLKSTSSIDKISLILVSAVFLVFGGWYFTRYHFIPIWDNAFYWMATLSFNNTLFSIPHDTIVQMFDSVNKSDYNQLLCWVMSFPVHLFPNWTGTFFTELILAVIPASLLMAAFLWDKVDVFLGPNKKPLPMWVFYLLVLLTPVALRPVFSGYLDGMGFLLFVALFVSLFDSDLPNRRFGAIAIGLGLCCVFLIRRWFVFGVIGLAVSVVIYWVCQIIRSKAQDRLLLFKKLVLRAITIAVALFAPVLLFFQGFLNRSFGGDYSQSYHSWTLFNSYSAKFANLFEEFGWLWFALSLISIAVIAWMYLKKSQVAEGLDFAGLAMLVISSYVGVLASLLVFWRIQDFSPQHWYIVIPGLWIAVLLPLLLAFSIPVLVSRRAITGTIAVVLSIANCATGLSAVSAPGILGKVMNAPIQTPFVQSDVEQKSAFVEYLKQKTQGTDMVYFAAASSDLNSTLPQTYFLPYAYIQPFPVASADVDSRDGFNTQFFDSKYVVTSSPVSVHMTKKNERVVCELNALVRDKSSYLGRHYKQDRSFQFSKKTTVTVYEKISPIEKDDVVRLQQYFTRIYPGSNKLFKDRFDEYLHAMDKNKTAAIG
ncbi:hypothetical protein OZX74_08340 [Bifidobacterium sp. ESL0798]|uniref:hypothetical protein n=1 Tax=Bifidobacterium sp. ESL0798 TaxID=2983235 RepID=UPI0023F69704|nr:hypothetical protein [Bifidobacterium sp. ESL0798]WEV73876.1 hypothetical protein OZX74_08340 [Bifidobacterium sp. ESL0798]